MGAFDFDAVVIGAGVVGLAVARELALSGRSTVVLEAAETVGTGTSSRNSEVIHAGIYYPPGSLKARLCVEGRHRLYLYAESRGIPHRRCGKFIVAETEGELPAVEALCERGWTNGVEDMEMTSAAKMRALEPGLAIAGGAVSPSTGIIDSHALMLALQGEAEDNGAAIAFNTPFEAAEHLPGGGFEICAGGTEPARFTVRELVNAAGLHASEAAAAIAGLAAEHVPPTRYARGCYFTLSGRAPFSRLIYPLPTDAGLGVHYTLDLGGQGRFGPDVEWIERIEYAVAAERSADFYAAVRRFWPALPDGALVPGYSGIRPKLTGPGEPPGDFRIDGPETHGIEGLVNLLGIESPGLTSCLALAEEVCSRLQNGSATATIDMRGAT